MGILIDILPIYISLYDFFDVLIPEDVLVLTGLEILTGINEKDVVAVAVPVLAEDEDRDRYRCSEEEVDRKPNDSVNDVQFLYKVPPDRLLGSAPEQNSVGQQDGDSAIIIHVVNHMLHKCQIRMGLRRQLAHAAITGIIQIIGSIGGVRGRIRRI